MEKTKGVTLLALFEKKEDVFAASQKLLAAGFQQDELSVLSAFPFPHGVFPVKEPSVPLPWFTLLGALTGIVFGLLLTFGTSFLYPIKTGHMPVYPAPPYGIIAYETMMLAALTTTIGVFAAFILFQRFGQKKTLCDPAIFEGQIGLALFCKENEKVSLAEECLKEAGALKISSAEGNHL